MSYPVSISIAMLKQQWRQCWASDVNWHCHLSNPSTIHLCHTMQKHNLTAILTMLYIML